MLVLSEIVERYGGAACFREVGVVHLKRFERTLLIEHLGFGPTAEHAMRVVKSNCFGAAGWEVYFEWKGGVWLPYYLNNKATDTELFLYHFNGAQEVLRVDLWAGVRMIEIAGVLDLNLWAEGFVEAAEENLYHPLFTSTGGAA